MPGLLLKLGLIACAIAWAAPAARADGFVAAPTTVNGCSGACTVQPGNFYGTFTVANLLAKAPCDGVTIPIGGIATVSDLGGWSAPRFDRTGGISDKA